MIIGVQLKKQYRGKTGDFFMGFDGSVRKFSRKLDSKLTRHIAESEESLKITLHNRIALAKPGAIEMNGIELIATLSLIDESADIDLHESQTYLIPLTEAQKILSELEKRPPPDPATAM